MRILKAIIKVLQGAIINWFDKKKNRMSQYRNKRHRKDWNFKTENYSKQINKKQTKILLGGLNSSMKRIKNRISEFEDKKIQKTQNNESYLPWTSERKYMGKMNRVSGAFETITKDPIPVSLESQKERRKM